MQVIEPKSVNSKISGSQNFRVVYDSSKDVNLFIVIFADRQAIFRLLLFLQTDRPTYLDFYNFKIWTKKTLNSVNYFMFLYLQV